MYLADKTLDDLLRRVLLKLLKSNTRVSATRGSSRELSGVLLQLRNPRARMSHTERKTTLVSCLGELLWYLSKSDALDFIRYYLRRYDSESEDGLTIHGAYGPRLFAMRGEVDQVANVIQLLRETPSSRRAVIQLFNAEDIAKRYREIPCTCCLQFMIRRQRLDMLVTMRSNDAFLGLPHDVFAFTMLQEIVARILSVGLGSYKHFVGSLHLYDANEVAAAEYVNEGWQPIRGAEMPAMPQDDPMPSITKVLEVESLLRRGEGVDIAELDLDPYWLDVIRLLQIHQCSRQKRFQDIELLGKQMSSSVFGAYIAKRQALAR